MARLLYRWGRWCAVHGGMVLGGWVLIVGLALGALMAFGAQTSNDLALPGTGSQAVKDLLTQRFPPQQNGVNQIVFAVEHGALTDADNKQAVKESVQEIRRQPHVYSVTNPLSTAGRTAGLLSKDSRIAFAPVLLDIDSSQLTVPLAQRVLDATGPARRAGITTAAGGSIGSTLSSDDSEVSEIVGIVAAMIILTFVLGSLVAMGLPIITAVVGLATALSVVGLLGHVISIPSAGPTLATMIGLGVGIDYSLFLIARHQDQLGDGRSVTDSVASAVATSGSAIVFAGTTVVIALLSLGVAGIPLVSALGLASAIAVVCAVLVALSLLPALLGLLGPRINRFGLPAVLRARPHPGPGAWVRWAGVVRRRPWLVAGLSLAALVPLVIPAFWLQLGQEDIGAASPTTTERQAYDLITAGFGVGYNGPLQVASKLDPVAAPSAAYTTKYDQAQSLKKGLERKQKELPEQQQQLEAQQRQLEQEKRQLQRQQAQLEREGDRLQAEQASLERRADTLKAERTDLEKQAAALEERSEKLKLQQQRLEREKQALEREARALAARIRPLARELARILARERILERRIEKAEAAGDADRVARLTARLHEVQAREKEVRAALKPLEARAEALAREANTLQKQTAALQREADALQQQADALERQKRELQAEGASLQRQADQLQAQATRLQKQADSLQRQGQQLQAQATELQRQAAELKQEQQQAEQEQKQAEKLQQQLTDMVTQAGGDPRGTDPRVVDLQAGLSGTAGVVALTPPQLNEHGDVVLLSAVPSTSPASDTTADLVSTVRDTVLPETNASGGITSYVGGYTASYVDLASLIADRLLRVIGTVLLLGFLLLMIAFRSLLIPLQAAMTNLLSAAAAFGVLTAVFQWGWGLSAVGIDTADPSVPIASYVPLMMFAGLFGLSMDYEVFLVSHLQQRHQAGEDARDAVSSALASSARITSSAALIMAAVFASFILNDDPTIKQFGVGLSVAVLLAGILVVTLAPAVLVLLGSAAWWLPGWLDRLLPHLSIEGEADAVGGDRAPTG